MELDPLLTADKVDRDCSMGSNCSHSCARSKPPSTALHLQQQRPISGADMYGPLYLALQMMHKMTATMRTKLELQRWPLRSPRQTMMTTMAGAGSHQSHTNRQPSWQTLLQVRLVAQNLLHVPAVHETMIQAGRICFGSACLLQSVESDVQSRPRCQLMLCRGGGWCTQGGPHPATC